MQFSAARPLSVTDLEAPYERFKENVKRIEKSLRRIGYAAIILLVMTLVLYVPFFIIQFEAIFANVPDHVRRAVFAARSRLCCI